MSVPGPSERRFVVLGGRSLGHLPAGTPVGVPGPRMAALLRARHPDLVPVPGGDDADVRIVPLWTDPGLESRGELLERDGWLPGPGEGISVVLHRPGDPAAPPSDPAAEAVLRAERALARLLPGPGLSVLGQVYAGRIRLRALVVSPDGRRAVRGEGEGRLDDPEGTAAVVARVLEARGAGLLAFSPPG